MTSDMLVLLPSDLSSKNRGLLGSYVTPPVVALALLLALAGAGMLDIAGGGGCWGTLSDP